MKIAQISPSLRVACILNPKLEKELVKEARKLGEWLIYIQTPKKEKG